MEASILLLALAVFIGAFIIAASIPNPLKTDTYVVNEITGAQKAVVVNNDGASVPSLLWPFAAVPLGNEPGKYAIPALRCTIDISGWEVVTVYDTEVLDGGVDMIQRGHAEQRFFTEIEGKSNAATNLRTAAQLPGRHTMLVSHITLAVLPEYAGVVTDLRDAAAVLSNGTFELLINRKTVITEQRLAEGAVWREGQPFRLEDNDDFQAHVRFPGGGAYVAKGPVPITVRLHGIMKSPRTH